MKCEKYQNLISDYLDGGLDSTGANEIGEHLSICPTCAKLYQDFASILKFTEETFEEVSSPPNSQALWCRINNLIETEIQPQLEIEKASKMRKKRFIDRIWSRGISFSPAQIASSVLGIALISSLLTVVAIKNFSGPYEIHSDVEMQPTAFESVLSKIGIVETPEAKYQRRVNEQKSAIAYWEKRVELKKVQWDSHLQDAFDRNLKEINQVVNEYTRMLKENPHDKISTEMLDSALNEKMEFLREFSEL